MKTHEYATIQVIDRDTDKVKKIKTRCKIENKTQLILGTTTMTHLIRATRKLTNYDILVSGVSTIEKQQKYFNHGVAVHAEFMPELYRLALMTY